MTLLAPSEIFYSQDSIRPTFGEHCVHRYRLIGQTLDDICDGRCTINDIPSIRVVNKNGKRVTCDNRRLWIFRHLERLGKCDRVHVQVTSYIPTHKLTSLSDGREIKVRGRPGGIWHNKPSKRRNPPTPKPLAYNRRIYDSETSSPRPFSNTTAASIQSTPSYTFYNFQHTNMMHKQAEVDRLVYAAPSSIRSTSPRGILTENSDYGTISWVNNNSPGHSVVSSTLEQSNHAQQVQWNLDKPNVIVPSPVAQPEPPLRRRSTRSRKPPDRYGQWI